MSSGQEGLGGREGRGTFQLLILSPNLLKSKIPHVEGGGGGEWRGGVGVGGV